MHIGGNDRGQGKTIGLLKARRVIVDLGVRQTLLRRPRILEWFSQAARHHVTLVVAPAGCGKTAALDQFLATLDTALVRFDARSEHATLSGFARGFADALQVVAPHARAHVGEALRSALLTPWLLTHLESFSGAVVVDDAHLLDAASARTLVETIERTPRIRWIIAARNLDHFPIGAWITKGIADLPLGETSLAFTAEEIREAAAFFECALDERDVALLGSMTGGWAAGTSIALRTALHSSDLARVAVTARQLTYHYLNDVVFAPLDDDERALLLFCGVLPEIDIRVLERAGFTRASRMLLTLAQQVALLRPAFDAIRDAAPSRYRCHDLFRDFLEHRLTCEDAQEVAALHLRAARALEACGKTREALRAFARSGDSTQTLRMLRAHGVGLMDRGDVDLLDEVLAALPEQDAQSSAIALTLRGMRAGHGGERAALSLLSRAFEAANDDRELRAHVAYPIAIYRLRRDEPFLDLLDSLAFDRSITGFARARLLKVMVLGLSRTSQREKLVAAAQELDLIARDSTSDEERAVLLYDCGSTYSVLGEKERARTLLETAAPLAIATGMHRLAGTAYTNLSVLAINRYADPAEASAYAQRAYEINAKYCEPSRAFTAVTRWLDAALTLGNAEQIERCITLAAQWAPPEFPHMWHAYAARRDAMEGRFDHVCPDGYLTDLPGNVNPFDVVDYAFCAVSSALSERTSQCDALLEVVIRRARSHEEHEFYSAWKCDLALSLAALAQAFCARPSVALRRLTTKPDSAAPVLRFMRDAIAQIVKALHHKREVGDLSSSLEQLRALGFGGYALFLDAVAQHVRARNRRDIALTATELEIVRELAAGHRPKEIAVARGSSPGTIRTHIARIVAKFGCSGSPDAVSLARSRGLI